MLLLVLMLMLMLRGNLLLSSSGRPNVLHTRCLHAGSSTTTRRACVARRAVIAIISRGEDLASWRRSYR
jgi:hypothetical protein